MTEPRQPSEPVLLTLDQCADLCQVTRRFLEKRIAAGTGPTVVRMGSRIRIRLEDLTTWIEQLREPG